MKLLFISMIALSAALPAAAQDSNSYIDDRSDGAAVVRSLYNAIARQEYARAYGYFGDRKPQGDYQSFVAGYQNTADVQVRTGTVTPEGAAGSTYEPVPVAVRSVDKAGKEQIFAGCYLTRIASPTAQEPPFVPLHIESAELEAVKGSWEDAIPKVCHIPS